MSPSRRPEPDPLPIIRRKWVAAGLAPLLLLAWGIAGALESGSVGRPQLVHDFFPGEFERDGSPSQLTQLGGALFFVAQDLEKPPKVWRTTGSPEGTRPLEGAGFSGTTGDSQAIVGTVGRYLLWTARTAEAPGNVALLSSAERGDAVALHSYRPNPGDELAVTSRRFFFQDCTARCGLWSTDGTVAGTRPIRTLAGRFASGPVRIAGTFADRWLLLQSRRSLFAYDFLKDQILPLLPNFTLYGRMYRGESTLYFRTFHGNPERGFRERLWASRLDSPRAVQLFEDSHIGVSGTRGNLLYFAQEDGRLWSTDGRRENTRPYSGIRVESFSLVAGQLGSIGSRTFLPMPGYYWGSLLVADETKRQVRELQPLCSHKYTCLGLTMSDVVVAGGVGFESIGGVLLQSDGTRQGTRVHEILSRVDVSNFRVLDGRLLLGATSRQGEEQLWETDGTASGTRALSDGTLDSPFRVQGPPVALGGSLFVVAERKPVGRQLWRVENGRTTALTQVRHLASGLRPYGVFPLGDRVAIGGETLNGWHGLAEDGSTEQLPDFYSAGCWSGDEECAAPAALVGRRLLVTSFGGYLSVTDGTSAGTGDIPLSDGAGLEARVAALGRLGDRALVLGSAGGLWTSDGTAAGTRLFAQLPEGLGDMLPIGPPVSLGSLAVLFLRVPGPGGDLARSTLEVWRTDGTAEGTLRLASTPFPESFATALSPAVVGGRLFFRFGGRLWTSDGTATGTYPLRDQPPGGTFALAAGSETLYVAAGYQNEDEEQTLWAIDPVTLSARLLGSFDRISYGYVGRVLGGVLENSLFFTAVDEQGAERWWVTDGTAAGTHRVSRLPTSRRTRDFASGGGRFYLTVCDAPHGCELWSTDLSGEDTRIVQDLWPGPPGSDPQILYAGEDGLWFAATEPSVGREIWKIDLR